MDRILKKVRKYLLKAGLTEEKVDKIVNDIEAEKDDELETKPEVEPKLEDKGEGPVDDLGVDTEKVNAAKVEDTGVEPTKPETEETGIEEKVDEVIEDKEPVEPVLEPQPPVEEKPMVEEPTPMEEKPVEEEKDDPRISALESKFDELKATMDGLNEKFTSFMANLEKSGVIDVDREEPNPVGVDENTMPSTNREEPMDDIISRLNRGRGY